MSDWVEVRRGGYHDSVTLMRVSRQLAERPGVTGAMVAMATELNREMFARMGFGVPDGAGPDDLVVAIRVDGDGLDEAREAVDGLLREASRP
ncbi:FdrA family protein, partial [Actinomadura bangladeshensis]|nr:FdrA family protein [Actinomadura bangladeshensis]